MFGIEKLSSTVKIIIVAVLILMIAASGYLVYTNFIAQKTPIGPTVQTQGVNLTNTPVVTKFDEGLFFSPQMLELKKYGEWDYTKQYEATATDINIPSEPTNIEVLNPGTGGKLYVFWQLPKNNNFKKIYIYRFGVIIKDNLLPTDTFYQDDGLQNGVTYYYLVKTVNEANQESENKLQVSGTPTDIIPPLPPQNVQITDKGDKTSLEISWEAPNDPDFDFVRVYRSTQKGKLGIIIKDKTAGDLCSKNGKEYYCFVDKVTSGTTYYYTLTSLDASGNESSRRILTNPARSNPFEPQF